MNNLSTIKANLIKPDFISELELYGQDMKKCKTILSNAYIITMSILVPDKRCENLTEILTYFKSSKYLVFKCYDIKSISIGYFLLTIKYHSSYLFNEILPKSIAKANESTTLPPENGIDLYLNSMNFLGNFIINTFDLRH